MTRPKNAMRGFLTVLLVLGFCGSIAALFFQPIPDANSDLVTYMLGQLSGFCGAMLAVYSVSSKSSEDKNETIRRALERGVPADEPHPRSNTGFPFTMNGDQQ